VAKVRKLLIAENVPEQLRPRKELFVREGWEVLTAASPEEARHILDNGWVHLAVVDLRLRDDNDPNDLSGLELVKSTDPAIPKIMWSAFPSYEVATEALGLNANGIPYAVYFVDKARGFSELYEKVEEVFRDKVRINTELEIKSEAGASLRELLGQIEDYRGLPEDRLSARAEELEDLLRKLFLQERRLLLKHVTPGAGGSGVVRIQPTLEAGQGEEVIVKFGKRDNMRKEIGNFARYVQPYAGQYATALIGDLRETLHFGGARFSLVGRVGGEPRSFNAFYRQSSVKAIQQALNFLFESTCGRWYAGKWDWSDPELDRRPWTFDVDRLRDRKDVLAVCFEEQKNLSTEPRKQKLRDALDRIYTAKTLFRSRFRRVDDSTFEVTFGSSAASTTLRLPDPMHFIATQRNRFPPPTYWAITHGDLHSGNILVDEEGHTWLIDFYKTGWGPALRDLAQLEASIRLELIETDNLYALSQFEAACMKARRFDQEIEFSNEFKSPELDKAIKVISYLRKLAMRINQHPDMKEHYIGLLYHTLRLSTWAGSGSRDERSFEARQRHALISAGLICDRLQRWDEEDWQIIR